MKRLICVSLVLGLVLSTGAPLRADAAGDCKAIIAKAIKAMGGEEKLTKNKAATWKGKGTVHAMGQTFDFTGEWAIQAPKQLKTQIEVEANGMKITILQILNGDKGWAQMGGPVEEMKGEQLAETQEEMYSNWVTSLVPLKDDAFKLSPLGDSKEGDKEVVGVKVSHKDHRDVELYFDKKDGFLLKSKKRIKDIMGGGQEKDQEAVYSDYKDTDGVMRFRKLSIKRDGQDFVDVEITEYKAVEKLDDSIFAKPGE
jgi:hypothetical protein